VAGAPTKTDDGLDLWRRQDQAGNDPAATMANAEAEGVAGRVELRGAAWACTRRCGW